MAHDALALLARPVPLHGFDPRIFELAQVSYSESVLMEAVEAWSKGKACEG